MISPQNFNLATPYLVFVRHVCIIWTNLPSSTEKVVGTATPKQPHEGYQFSWSFSNEYELSIQWESSTSPSGFRFDLKSTTSAESTVSKVHLSADETTVHYMNHA